MSKLPLSADHAMAWFDYASIFLHFAGGWNRPTVPAMLNRALEIAEAAAATALIPRILAIFAEDAFWRGQIDDGFAFLERGWALARASQDVPALLWLAVGEGNALLKLAEFRRAGEVALDALGHARQGGLEASLLAAIVVSNASEALLARGGTAEAAAVIDPLTAGAPDRLHLLVHEARVEIDLLRGEIDAAVRRQQLIDAIFAHVGNVEFARESAQRAVELALWAGRPGDAQAEVQRALPLFKTPDLTIACGRLLVAGMRACADLAERARARRDQPAADCRHRGRRRLGLLGRAGTRRPVHQAPVRGHDPRRTCHLGRRADAAGRRQRPGCVGHGSESLAGAGLPAPRRVRVVAAGGGAAGLRPALEAAADALRAAAAAGEGHAPLLAQVHMLARRARILLQSPVTVTAERPRPEAPVPYGLTDRELAVLKLVAAGRTNAQIGAELYISHKTASVHVSNILRKLGVSGRAQAAALAERAGLLAASGAKAGPTRI